MNTTAEMPKPELDGLRELFQQAPAAMAILRGPSHVFEMANPAYLGLVAHREILGKTVAAALPEVVDQGFIALLDKVYHSGKAHVGRSIPVALWQADGVAQERRVLDFVYQPLRGKTGEVTGIFVQATDVTDRVLAEQALARQRRLYEAILTNTPDLAYIFDLSHRFIYANEGLLKMWGRSWDEAIGRNCLELGYEPWHAAMHDREIDQVVTTKQPVRGEVPFTGTFGRRIYDYLLVPVLNSNGEVEAVAGTTRDVTERKKAEEALREHEQMTALALRGGRMGTWVRDIAGGTVHWSGDLEALFGLAPGSFGGSEEAFLELVHPQDRDALTQAVARALDAQTDYRVEFRFRDPAGEWRWMEGRGRAVYDGAGRPVRLYGIGIDITERKLIDAELLSKREALSQSESRFRRLIEAAPVGIALSEPDGSVVLANDALLAILGHARADIERCPLDWRRFTPPEHLTRDLAYMEELRRGHSPPPFEKDLVRADGSRVPVLMAARFLPGEGERMVAYALDISDLRQAEEALRRSERRLSRIFETNLLGVLYFDLNGGVQDANDELLNITGYTREDLVQGLVDWSRMTPAEFKEQDARAVDDLRHSGSHAPIEKQYVRKNGERVWVLVGSALFDHENGVGFVLDLSGVKRAEEALRNANRRKDEFLATLAHELRNPLAPIRNAVHLMKRIQPMHPQLHSVRDIIDRQVRHMVRLVDDLLDVSRITLGQVNLRSEVVSLGGVLTDAIEAARPLIEASEHSFTVQMPSENMQIEGDGTRLSQVFQNLLNNAAKYTPKGGRITLVVERDGDTALVVVRDNGIGIPEELHSRIFELFTRAHPAEEIKTSGLGIGLALARQLVELHGGEIALQSSGPGAGSEFMVRLPLLHTPRSMPEVASVPEGLHIDERRVLVVDDNRDAAESLAMLLQQAGCTVEVALDGVAALTALPRFRPDIVLLDIGMPGMDGYTTARHMRATPQGRDVLLIALTGWAQDEDKRRAREAGFDEHLTKPVDPAVLNTLLTLERTTPG
jgi:PAS domain S-box-containing protein